MSQSFLVTVIWLRAEFPQRWGRMNLSENRILYGKTLREMVKLQERKFLGGVERVIGEGLVRKLSKDGSRNPRVCSFEHFLIDGKEKEKGRLEIWGALLEERR